MLAKTPLPRLRRDVELLEEDGRVLLVDPVVGVVHKMTPVELAVIRALDGKRSLEAVALRAALSPRKVRALVARLEEEHLLETDRIRARLEAHQTDHDDRSFDTPEKMMRLRRLPLADPQTRWDCHAC